MDFKARILVIEDDPDGLRSVQEAIAEAGHTVATAARGRTGLDLFRDGEFDVVLTDLKLPDIDGLDVLAAVNSAAPGVPVLIMTAYGSVETAVKALKSGAYDYMVKPLDLDDVQVRIGRAVETSRLRAEVASIHHELASRYTASAMVAGSPAMQEVIRRIAMVAGTNATVLITGESGTGKELAARALHVDGRWADGPFVAVNCGAFTESLLESELFGHEKGAFTGAAARHAGAFERAHGGTLFLDEIGLAPKSAQMRLLRAIEEREVLRVGGRDVVKVNVRIIAASNRNLKAMADAREFLPDLLYRLQVVSLVMPPLRSRREDIRPLAERFIKAAAAEHGRRIDAIGEDYFQTLERQEWPGNIRELKHAVEASVIMAQGTKLTAGDLTAGQPATGGGPLVIPADTTLIELEKRALVQALQRHGGNREDTAHELGISSRTVIRKIQEYQLPF